MKPNSCDLIINMSFNIQMLLDLQALGFNKQKFLSEGCMCSGPFNRTACFYFVPSSRLDMTGDHLLAES